MEFRLYAVDNDTKEVTQVLPSVFLNAKNNWETVFKVLPPEEANVQYYLYENAVGFTPVYEHTDTIFINGKLQKVGLVTFQEDTGQAIPVVVTNYVMQELPKTGGSGVTPYTTAGLLLMAIALYLLYNKFMKCRKEDFILP